MPNPLLTPNGPFSGFDHVCAQCAQEAHARAGTAHPVVPPQAMWVGCCASCGDLVPLLESSVYHLPPPPRPVYIFAHAVIKAGHPEGIGRIRSRYAAGYYWVEFSPIGAAAIHTEPTRNRASAVAAFVAAAALHPTRPARIAC